MTSLAGSLTLKTFGLTGAGHRAFAPALRLRPGRTETFTPAGDPFALYRVLREINPPATWRIRLVLR